jgi:predicted MPP superfamily phosphohydrolase
MVIFFGIVLIIYGLVNYYILMRGLSVVPTEYKTLFLVIGVFIVLSYIAGRILENYFPSFISTVLIWIGSFWIAFMFYFFISLLFIDLFRLVNHFIPFFPPAKIKNPDNVKRLVALIVLVFVIIAVAGGYINARSINVKYYKIYIHKKAGNLKSLNIVMASDIHLGTILGKSFMEKVADKINSINPEIVLLAGDIIDEDITPVLNNNMGSALEKIKSKYGTYAITGNHEYIGGANAACDYLNHHGVKMLRDSVAEIDDSFYIIGREDRSIRQFANKQRKELTTLMNGVDSSKPLILMDHQPFGLHEAFDNKIDLQLSGHTHNGQLWPLNFLISKIYELGWGYMVKDKTHYYVSCGIGGWGPPIRTGSMPEIVNIKLIFDGVKETQTKK